MLFTHTTVDLAVAAIRSDPFDPFEVPSLGSELDLAQRQGKETREQALTARAAVVWDRLEVGT